MHFILFYQDLLTLIRTMITGGATDDLEEILAEGGILLPGPSNGNSIQYTSIVALYYSANINKAYFL